MSMMMEHVRKDPQVGCLSLANHLTGLGIRLSPPTVQKYLNRWRLGYQQARERWVRSGCPHIELSGPLPGPKALAPENYKRARSYFFSGIPKHEAGGIEIRHPSLMTVSLALRVPLADLQAIADREHWIESREQLLAQFQAQTPEREKEGDQALPSVVEGEAANLETSSWQSILFKAIASTSIARQGVKQTQSIDGQGAESSLATGEVTPSEDFKRRAAYWMKRWPRPFEIH
jgi:hypothetical protein